MRFTMDMVHFIFVFACVQYTVVSTPVQRLCPRDQFLDEDFGVCTRCSEVCEDMEVKGTRALCEFFCPDYKAEERKLTEQALCPPDTYLDDTLRCEFCSDICQGEKKEDRCETKCPDYKDKSPMAVKLHFVLWVAVVFLSIVLLFLMTAIVLKTVRLRKQARSRRTNYRKNGPFIVPYLKLDEEKPDQRVNQWLNLLHSTEAEPDSSFGSKSSLIYTPPKTKV